MGSQEFHQTTCIGRMLRPSVIHLDWFILYKYVFKTDFVCMCVSCNHVSMCACVCLMHMLPILNVGYHLARSFSLETNM